MNRRKKLANQLLSGFSNRIVRQNVNSACWWYLYQDKLPKGWEKMRQN